MFKCKCFILTKTLGIEGIFQLVVCYFFSFIFYFYHIIPIVPWVSCSCSRAQYTVDKFLCLFNLPK